MIQPVGIKHNLLAAFGKILRPIVRIAIRNGVMHTDFAKEVRVAFLDAARDLSIENGRTPTETRVRLMTGLSTSDAAAAREMSESTRGEADSRLDTHTAAAMVLSAWLNEGGYSAIYGVPLELSLTGTVSIADLVSRVAHGADAEVIAERLIDAGCIKEVSPGRYTVQSRVYMPHALTAESVQYFAEATERFICTVEHNIQAGETRSEKRLERVVFADRGISESALPEFQEFVKGLWKDFADPVDTWLNTRVSPGGATDDASHADAAHPGVETGVGVYHYVIRRPRDGEPRASDKKDATTEGNEQ